jgi:hypothetical protein
MTWDQSKDRVKYVEGRKYTDAELNALADQVLKDDSNSPKGCTCPPPGQRDKDCTCSGKRRGIDGENPILFDEHQKERKRREIYTKNGTPDPSLVQGIYNRTHPEGRKVNTDEQRRKNGASYYR